MTLVLSGAGRLSQIQWGVNELASSLFVGKQVGTILTRKFDADVFRVLQAQYGVKVKSIPMWMENIRLNRNFSILGDGMRRINGATTMEELQINSLQGVATFMVLCCRYVLSTSAMIKTFETFLMGGLGAVDKGRLDEEGLPYALKPLIATFVRATKDADAASTQSANAKTWMAALLMQMKSSWSYTKEANTGRTYTRIQQFLGDLLGGPTVEEELLKHTQPLFHQAQPGTSSSLQADVDRPAKRIHDTISLDVAYIALAAAANGADICVEYITEDRRSIIPDHLKSSGSAFKLRLWLCQPPPHVSQILRFSDSKETATYMSSDNSHNAERDSTLTVFGGQLELITSVSSALVYNSSVDFGRERPSMGSELWYKGFDKGQSLSWAVQPTPNRLYPLRFRLLTTKPRLPPEAAHLAQRIARTDERLTSLSRDIAGIIDETYHWSSYTSSENEAEMTAAMKLVSIAVAVGSLHKMTQPLADDEFQYALNLKVVERDGCLANFCPKAFSEGLSHQELLWAASTLWGGASLATQGHFSVNDSVQGIVAPHCVVILDIIRNPLQFARDGMRGRLMTMCRGSVPLLPRDPNSGFVLGPNTKDTEGERQEVNVNDLADSDTGRLRGDLVVTFEPDVLGRSPFRSIFCCWFMGNLAFEIDPIVVFKNILGRGTEAEASRVESDPQNEISPNSTESEAGIKGIKEIAWTDLLSFKRFRTVDIIGLVNTFDSPGWLIGVAGLAQPGRVVFQRLENIDWDMCPIENEDTVILSTLNPA